MNAPIEVNPVIEAINARRSVRAYRADKVDRHVIIRLLCAAVRAPTAIHQDLCAFTIVQDPDLLKFVSDQAKPLFAQEVIRSHLDHGGHGFAAFAQPGFNIFYDAGTLIVICAPSATPFAVADSWLAAENLMIAACALGLGSCVIGSALGALELPEVKARLGIPGEFFAVAPIIVGHPRFVTSQIPRREPRILDWK